MKKLLFCIGVLSIPFLGVSQSQVTFYTNHGNFEVELHDSVVPITAGNFKNLTDSGFYDGVIFHRVIQNFVIQGGDPTGVGNGGPGYTIPDEFDPTMTNLKKTLSMANSGPNTGGSQFFINLKNNTFLDYDKAPLTSAHPVFGVVRTGWNSVVSIEATPVNGQDRPINDAIMDSIRTTGSYLSQEEIIRMQTVTEIYPNPISSESVLDIYMDKSTDVSLSIINQNGSVLYSQKRDLQQGKTLIPMNEMGHLVSGAYILVIEYDGVSKQERFIVVE